MWDSYYNAFLKADIFRKSCYSSVYASKKRISDITLGAFWNARENIMQLSGKVYISSVIVNTAKGEQLLNECKGEIDVYPSDFEVLEKSTHAVSEPTKRTHSIDVERLKECKNYSKWVARYECSLGVIGARI